VAHTPLSPISPRRSQAIRPSIPAAAAAAAFLYVAVAAVARGQQTTWVHDPATAGDWFTPTNWSAGVPSNVGTAAINNGGTAEIAGATATLLTASLGTGSLDSGAILLSSGIVQGQTRVGESGVGTFTQNDGTINGTVYLGYNAGGRGTYFMNGGTASSVMFVGYSGNGTLVVNHAGSIATGITLGRNAGSVGTLVLNSGTVTRQIDYGQGTGRIIQTGGTIAADFDLAGGYAYELSDGQINAGAFPIWIGSPGNGSADFHQTGGSVSGSGAIELGVFNPGTYRIDAGTISAGSLLFESKSSEFIQTGGLVNFSDIQTFGNGTYTLSGGTLSVSGEEKLTSAGSVRFTQTGGSNSTAYLTLGSNYTFGGGTLDVLQGITGRVDFVGSASAALTYGGLVDLSASALTNASNTTLAGRAGSLLVLPAGFDPATGFASFSTQGSVHTSGTPLNIPAGTGFNLRGTINDPVVLGGTLSQQTSGVLSLANGIILNSPGAAFTGGNVTVKDTTSGMSDGQLSAFLSIENSGRFTQSAGTFSGNSVTINSGTYEISGGQMTASLGIGPASGTGSSGLFFQTGGVATLSSVTINPTGTFRYTAGSLNVAGPLKSSGTMDFSGATSTLTVDGLFDSASGTFTGIQNLTLNGGANSLLIFAPGFDPAAQFGSFSSSGIVHTAGTTLVIPAGKSISGPGTINDPVQLYGSLTNVTLNNSLQMFEGSSGVLSQLSVNNLTSGMSGGSLVLFNRMTVGQSSGGQFAQSGGTLTYADLSVGGDVFSGSSAVGTFVLQGGMLQGVSAASGNATIGFNGTGTFIQNGGTYSLVETPNFPSDIYLAGGSSGRGTYILNGGQLKVATIHLGYVNTGTFEQHGGTATANSITMGEVGSGVGTLLIGDGTLNVPGSQTGSGTALLVYKGNINQSGGTFVVASGSLGSSASLTLSGGRAIFAQLTNSGTFLQTGGALTFGSFTNSGRATIGQVIQPNPSSGLATFNNTTNGSATFTSDVGATGDNGALRSVTGSILFNASQHLARLDILNSSRATLSAGAKVINTNELTAPTTGFIDLTDGTLIVDYADGDPSPFPTLRGAIVGRQVRTSLPDAHHALGVAEASLLFGGSPGTFHGEPVDATSVLITYTYSGDANLDGKVDVTDLGVLATQWQTSGVWTSGDFNYDGFVDVTDLGALATNWQAGVGNPLAPSLNAALAAVGLAGTAIPEPGGLVGCGLAALALRTRVRRR
jgi:hypothetical protein